MFSRTLAEGVTVLDVLLGVDLGTTNIKAVAYNVSGQPLAEVSNATPSVPDGPRRAVLDAQVLTAAAAEAIRGTVAQLPAGGAVCGVCIASVGEAGVPLDARGEPIYPLIAWYDERTAPQAAWWAEQVGETTIYRHTGLPLGHTFSLNKLLWLREHEPDVVRRMRMWLCVSDYVAYWLTGVARMGYSLASRTMALDLAQRRWSEEMLAAAGLAAERLPSLAAEGSLLGGVTPQAAERTGLPRGVPVYVGGHDHVCGAVAMGATEPGVVLDSTGTTEAELTTIPSVAHHLQAADLSFCLGCHVVPERYYAIGSILGAGSMIDWLAQLLWPTERGRDRRQAIDALTAAAANSSLGAEGLYLLPYLAGAGSPDRDSTARGVFVGLSLSHTREDIARSAIEGLAFELRTLWEALEELTRQPIERVVSVGGATRNRFWSQVKADITGRALHIPVHSEAVTLGAAMLAGIGAGIYRDVRDAQGQVRLAVDVYRPNCDDARRYERIYQRLIAEIRPEAAVLGRRSGRLL